MEENNNPVEEVLNSAANIDVNAEFKATEGFFKEFIKSPVDAVMQEAKNSKVSMVMFGVLMLLWMLVSALPAFVNQIRTVWRLRNAFVSPSIFTIVTVPARAALAPVIGVVIISLVIFAINNTGKKSIGDIIKLVAITQIPSIVASVIFIANILGTWTFRFLFPVGSLGVGLSILLLFTAIKTLNNEESNSQAFFSFAKVYGIYMIARIFFSLIGVSI